MIVDTEIWWDEVRTAFAAHRAAAWTAADRQAVMGRNSRGWAIVMRDRLGLDEPLEAIEREVVDGMIARFAADPSPLIPGAAATIRRLAARYPLAIASSAHPDVIAAALRTTGLGPSFRVVAASDEVPDGKPHPDVYLLAAERLAIEPRRCLVVEDSLNGVLAGRAAGMIVALVPNAAVPPAPGTAEAADVILSTIDRLDPVEIEAAFATRLADETGAAADPLGSRG